MISSVVQIMYTKVFKTAALIILLVPQTVLAQAAQAAPAPSFSQALGKMLPMFLMVFFIFYFMVLRPQQKKVLDQQKLLDGLKKGDTVLTTAGIIARVVSLEKDHIVLEVSNNVKVKFDRSHVSKKWEEPSAKAA